MQNRFVGDRHVLLYKIVPRSEERSNNLAPLCIKAPESVDDLFEGSTNSTEIPFEVLLVLATIPHRHVSVAALALLCIEPLLLPQLAVDGAYGPVVVGPCSISMIGGTRIHLAQVLDKEDHLFELHMPESRFLVQPVDDFG